MAINKSVDGIRLRDEIILKREAVFLM